MHTKPSHAPRQMRGFNLFLNQSIEKPFNYLNLAKGNDNTIVLEDIKNVGVLLKMEKKERTQPQVASNKTKFYCFHSLPFSP
jgi:hypothetical protein